jgi:hypothetical protein
MHAPEIKFFYEPPPPPQKVTIAEKFCILNVYK